MLARVWKAKERPTVPRGESFLFLEGVGDFSFSYSLPVATRDSPQMQNLPCPVLCLPVLTELAALYLQTYCLSSSSGPV